MNPDVFFLKFMAEIEQNLGRDYKIWQLQSENYHCQYQFSKAMVWIITLPGLMHNFPAALQFYYHSLEAGKDRVERAHINPVGLVAERPR